MNDIEFKIKVVEDLGIIKAKVEVLEKHYVPCEKESIKDTIKTHKKMIFGLYGFFGLIFLAVVGALLANQN